MTNDTDRLHTFYREVLGAEERYSDPDFAAMRLAQLDFMLHADHTYDGHPWYPRLKAAKERGLGAELRLLGVDPDEVESRARKAGAAILQPANDKAHGWREVVVQDPDGYVWALGVTIGG
ncbi:MAG: hypothetical protein IIA23_07710 [Chloroflexi bacterium]|nr:hypothetical protein [Chloroflexota bacterium]